MPHRRPVNKGSFGGHFDEMVRHFPSDPAAAVRERLAEKDPRELKEKLDIHAILFERAWSLEHQDGSAR